MRLVALSVAFMLASPLLAVNEAFLKAGSSITLRADDEDVRVTCESRVDELPRCSVKKEAYFNVHVGEDCLARYVDLEQAITAIKGLREAGLCR